jgi:hypothetical protein
MDIPLLRCSRSHWMAAGSQQTRFKSKSTLRYDQRSVGQSVLVSRSMWDPRPDFCYSQTAAVLPMWGALMRGRVCPVGARYIASDRRAYKTPPPTALLLLRVYSLPSNSSLVWWRKSVFTVPLSSNGWRLLQNYSVMSQYILFLNCPPEAQALQCAVPTFNESYKILYRDIQCQFNRQIDRDDYYVNRHWHP